MVVPKDIAYNGILTRCYQLTVDLNEIGGHICYSMCMKNVHNALTEIHGL